ncbi:MAG TPA: LLM class flavin-dependent oxidoreductase, partial [Acidimicrobiales bacterium]|nr:LLM class flavin-dependent oxidoreductase [Acidimicrobiales bacterium]
ESLQVLEALLSGESATFDGRHYRVTGAPGLPAPRQRPRPPLLIGGGSPRVLALAARHADIIGVNPSLRAGAVGPEMGAEVVPAKFDQKIEWVRRAAGDRMDDIELQCLTFMVQVGVDPKEVAAATAPMFGLEPDEALEVPIALIGSVDDICEALEKRRQRWGFTYWVVHEAEMVAFAEVVARMTGG